MEETNRVYTLGILEVRGKELEKQIWETVHRDKSEAYDSVAKILDLSPLRPPILYEELLPDGINPNVFGIQPFQLCGKKQTHFFGEETVIKRYDSEKEARSTLETMQTLAYDQPSLVPKDITLISGKEDAILLMKRIPGIPGPLALQAPNVTDRVRLKHLEMIIDAGAVLQKSSRRLHNLVFPKLDWYVERMKQKLAPVEKRGAKCDRIIEAVQKHNERISRPPIELLFGYLDLGPQNFLFSHTPIEFRNWPSGLMKIDFDNDYVRCGINDILIPIQGVYSRMHDELKSQQTSVENYLFNRWLIHHFGPLEALELGYKDSRKIAEVVGKLKKKRFPGLSELCKSEEIIRHLTIAGDKAREQEIFELCIRKFEEVLNLDSQYAEKNAVGFPNTIQNAFSPEVTIIDRSKEDYRIDGPGVRYLKYCAFVIFREWLKYVERYHVDRAIKSAEKIKDFDSSEAIRTAWKLPKVLLNVQRLPYFGETVFYTKSREFYEGTHYSQRLRKGFEGLCSIIEKSDSPEEANEIIKRIMRS